MESTADKKKSLAEKKVQPDLFEFGEEMEKNEKLGALMVSNDFVSDVGASKMSFYMTPYYPTEGESKKKQYCYEECIQSEPHMIEAP